MITGTLEINVDGLSGEVSITNVDGGIRGEICFDITPGMIPQHIDHDIGMNTFVDMFGSIKLVIFGASLEDVVNASHVALPILCNEEELKVREMIVVRKHDDDDAETSSFTSYRCICFLMSDLLSICIPVTRFSPDKILGTAMNIGNTKCHIEAMGRRIDFSNWIAVLKEDEIVSVIKEATSEIERSIDVAMELISKKAIDLAERRTFEDDKLCDPARVLHDKLISIGFVNKNSGSEPLLGSMLYAKDIGCATFVLSSPEYPSMTNTDFVMNLKIIYKFPEGKMEDRRNIYATAKEGFDPFSLGDRVGKFIEDYLSCKHIMQTSNDNVDDWKTYISNWSFYLKEDTVTSKDVVEALALHGCYPPGTMESDGLKFMARRLGRFIAKIDDDEIFDGFKFQRERDTMPYKYRLIREKR